jgi:hypothetical protein
MSVVKLKSMEIRLQDQSVVQDILLSQTPYRTSQSVPCWVILPCIVSPHNSGLAFNGNFASEQRSQVLLTPAEIIYRCVTDGGMVLNHFGLFLLPATDNRA